MKKLTMIAALVLLMTVPMMAEHVSPETAQKVAKTFLRNNGAKGEQLTDLTKAAGFANLYIFNANPGFVVMAADDRVQPILGYSFENTFVAEDMPDNVRGWLQGYSDEIQYAIDSKMKATSETTKLWKDLMNGNTKAGRTTTVVDALIQTKWNQNPSPYYDSVPSGCVTGCVATAMAQIMNYHQYPARGIGHHSYTWNSRTLSANFGATTYNWSNMRNTYGQYYDSEGHAQYDNGATLAQKKAVAQLMYHCGVSVDMSYGSSSSASTAAVVGALKTYFNYSADIVYRTKSDFGDDAWKEMVRTELDEGRPLQYRGSQGSEGHSFVCDGYDNADNFHFNWGWAGKCDGYYPLSGLTPTNPGTGGGSGNYTNNQAAIFGIHPSECTLGAPTNLTRTPNDQQTATLNWEGVSGATSYNVYYERYRVGNVQETTFTHTAPFGSGYYYVRCVDSDGYESIASNPVFVSFEYPTPLVNDLTATYSGSNAEFTWTAPEWCFPSTPSETLTYGTQSNCGAYFKWNDSRYWGHRYISNNLSDYNGMKLFSVDFYAYNAGNYDVCIYTGTDTNGEYNIPVTLVATQSLSVSGDDWYTFNLDTPITIDDSQDLWVFIHNPQPISNLEVYLCDNNGLGHGCYYSGDIESYTFNNYPEFAFLIKTHLSDGTYTYNLYQDGIPVAEDLTETTYNATLNDNAANLFTVTTNYYGCETGASNKVGFAKGTASLASLEMDDNDQMTVTEGSTLTVETLSNDNAANLVIENGAQLVNDSEDVLATVKKTIAPYTEGTRDGWNLIASPVTESLNAANDVEGLITNNYDLYAFDQSAQDEYGNAKEWRNYKANTDNFPINHKTGYLYANSDETTMSFVGTLAGATDATPLAFDNNAMFKGFNLIGNPYPCNAYINKPFYVLQYNEAEDKTSFIDGDNPIPPCAAVLVEAQSSEEEINFSKTPLDNTESSALVVRLYRSDIKSAGILDQARISFQENCQLTKYTWGEPSSMVYISKNGHDYAVAYAGDDREMPLNFTAAQNGTYTLTVESQNLELSYLHLVDNITGDDVDLLATPNYTFTAQTTDYATRFRLVFVPNSENTVSDSEAFAYVSNGEIVIIADTGTASLQVIDVTGRVVRVCTDVARNVSTTGIPAGVYVLRLIDGENVKTQKIVIE